MLQRNQAGAEPGLLLVIPGDLLVFSWRSPHQECDVFFELYLDKVLDLDRVFMKLSHLTLEHAGVSAT